MSWFGRLLGTDSVVNGVVGLVDNAFFTDQERSEAWRKMMAAYEPFKLAQRLLALTFGIPFVFVFLVVVISFLNNWIDKATAELVMQWNVDTLGDPVFWIVLFYFGGGAFEGAINARYGKK